MAPYLGADHCFSIEPTRPNPLLTGTKSALQQLVAKACDNLPAECLPHIKRVKFSTANTGTPYFPSPLKQTEAISALKAVEASVASAIADFSKGSKARSINVDLERATAFLFSTYLATVGGLDKQHPKVKKLLKGKFTTFKTRQLETNPSRHRSTQGTIYSLPEVICQPLPDQECGRVLPPSWVVGGDKSLEYDWPRWSSARPPRLP